MRVSWAQGAVVALSLTAGIGLLDTPARLLGPASIAESPLNLPRTVSPSIVIATLPAVAPRLRPVRHPPATVAPVTAPPPAAIPVVERLPVPTIEPPRPKRTVHPAPIRAPVRPRRIPPDEPRVTPTPAPAPAPAPIPSPPPLAPTDTPTTPAAPDPTPTATPTLAPAATTTTVEDDTKPCPEASSHGQGGGRGNGHEPQGKACGHNG